LGVGGRRRGEVAGRVLIRLFVRGIVDILAAGEALRAALVAPDGALGDGQRGRMAGGLVHLQDSLGDLEGLGQQHAGVVPQRLVEQSPSMAGDRGRVVGEVGVVVEVGEDVAGLGAKAGSATATADAADATIATTIRACGQGRRRRRLDVRRQSNRRRDVVGAQRIRCVT